MKRVNCILLIDDNPADNYYNEYLINESGKCNHLKIALNGIEALDYLNKYLENGQPDLIPKPDIIFLDINMPRMNGYEFLKEYEKFDSSFKSAIRIFMLTSSPNPDDRTNSLAFSEVTDYLIKPLSPEILEEIIERSF